MSVDRLPRPVGATLADLLANPERVTEIPAQSIPGLLGDLERLRTTLWARMMSASSNGQLEPPAEGDQLLTVEVAARKLDVSKDWLYRRTAKLPFTIRLGPRQLRFSVRGIERYIRQRQGR